MHDLAADDVGVGGETGFPVAVTQDRDGVAALDEIVLRGEDAPHGRAHTEHGEVIAGDEFTGDELCASFVGQAEGVAEAAEHALEDLVLVAEILVHGVGNRVGAGIAAIVRTAGGEKDELLGIAHRQELKNQLIDQREDGGIGADSQGEREHCDGSEQGRFAQGAKGVAQILNEVSHGEDTWPRRKRLPD